MSQISPASVRPWPLKASDPMAIVVAGVFLIASASGLVSLIGWTADQATGVQSGLLMIAASVRFWLEQRNAQRVAVQASQAEARGYREGLEKPQPRRVTRRGAPGEGGPVELPEKPSSDDEAEEDTPTNPQG